MFINMAFVTPAAGKEQEVLEIMRDFASSLRGSQGLLRVHVLKEKEGNVLLGISMWESEDTFNRAMASADSTPASGRKVETIRESPTIVRKFVEV